MNGPTRNKGFTIVELLIVIVVIAILAAVTIVAFNGIQLRANQSAVTSALNQANKKVGLYNSEFSTYPADLAAAGVTNSGTISFQYTSTASSYCITASKDGKNAYNITNSSAASAGPCEGQSGGTDYCPNDSFMPVNGYYCDGSEGSIASLNSNSVKLSSTASGVPANAPAGFVGRQNTRDSYINSTFSVTPGEVYCVQGYVATQSSTVNHAIGLQISDSTAVRATTWQSGGAFTPPTAAWKKISGCITIGSGYNQARFWTQNDGGNGDTALAYWYQTAIKITKQ